MIKNTVTGLGVLFVLVGILGLFQNPIFGVFAVDEVHNLIHFLTGVLAVIFGLSSEYAAKNYAKAIGFVYAIVAVIGLINANDTVMGLFLSNEADHLLHLVFSIIFLAVGYAPAAYSRSASVAR